MYIFRCFKFGLIIKKIIFQVHHDLADVLADVCVESILAIRVPDKPVDLHMVELMEMQHKTATDTQLVKGMVTIIFMIAFFFIKLNIFNTLIHYMVCGCSFLKI